LTGGVADSQIRGFESEFDRAEIADKPSKTMKGPALC
jgi:hypothetical protein